MACLNPSTENMGKRLWFQDYVSFTHPPFNVAISRMVRQPKKEMLHYCAHTHLHYATLLNNELMNK